MHPRRRHAENSDYISKPVQRPLSSSGIRSHPNAVVTSVYDIGRRADCGQLSRCTRHTSATQRFVPSRWRHRIDVGWPEWKVGVEYDGEQHWTDSNRHAEDIERLEYLAAQGWIIVRVGARQLRYDRAEILAHVRRALVQYL